MGGFLPVVRSMGVVPRAGILMNLYSTQRSSSEPLYQQSAMPPLYWLWFFIR